MIKVVDHGTGRTIAWGLGGRDAATCQCVSDQVTHLTTCIFYPDAWEACAQVLPPEQRIIGKAYTHAIARDNSNTRHHLARRTRKTKVVSKSAGMVHASESCGVLSAYPPSSQSLRKFLFLFA
jgi:insertion element IS1 protein InsB